MPPSREVDAHPDSVRHLRIQEKKQRLQFQLDRDYESLQEYWSSTFRITTAARSVSQPLSFATLWSLELSLASLQAEMGVSTLTKDKAKEIIQERRASYQQELQIDVYWFSGFAGTSIAGPGAQVRLRDGEGNTYRPTRSDSSPLRDAFLAGGETALYRRNFFYFKRVVDGKDILKDINELQLIVTPTGAPEVRFEWTWEDITSTADTSR